MTAAHLLTGKNAEDRACTHYQSRRGAQLLGRNVRYRVGELDLVFEERTAQGVELVFVEVRARTLGHAWESPLQSVTTSKRQRLKKAIKLYLMTYAGAAQALRFDVAAWDGAQLTVYTDIRL